MHRGPWKMLSEPSRCWRTLTRARTKCGRRGEAELVLDTPAGAVAPGQAAVLYDGERVLGGGWIRRRAAAAVVDSELKCPVHVANDMSAFCC